jgi:HEAT repeats
MTQQSPTRSFLVGATFRGAARGPRSGSALARLALAGLFGGGLLTPLALAQYPQTAPPANYGVPQSYAAPQNYPAPQNTATQNAGTNVSADPQLAGQTDEQLAAEARLFMQQGRTAPAQRIYLELQRRSIIRASALTQTPTPTFNHQPPTGFAPYGSAQPNAPTSTAAWGQAVPGYATNQRQVAPSQFPSAQVPPAFQPYQPTPQFQASAQAAPAAESWAQANANAQPTIETQPAANPPATTNTQTVDNKNFSPQSVQSQAAAPTQSTEIHSSPPPEVTVSVVAAPPVMVLDRQPAASPTAAFPTAAPATTMDTASTTAANIEPSSNGWRAAITPLPATLAQTESAVKPATAAAPVPFENSFGAKPVDAAPTNAGQANLTSTSAVPVSSTQPIAPPATNAIPANGETSAISTAHPLELAREAARQAADELPNFHTQPLPDLPPRTPPSATMSTGAPKTFDQEPPAFGPPDANRERRLAPAESTEPPEAPGVVTLPAAPPPVDLTPRQVPRTVPLATERETSNAILDQAAKLAKQTDDIRIIPGNRSNGYSRLETLLNVEGKNGATPPDSAFDIPSSGWKSTIPSGPPAPSSDAAPSSPRPDKTDTYKTDTDKTGTDNAGTPQSTDRTRREDDDERPAPRHVRTDAVADSIEATEPRASRAPRAAQFDDERRAEPKAAFDLAALIKDPEFREIHTRPVLDGLELLSQAEPRHRLLGAMRIGLSGPEARTALPVLRQLLTAEPNKAVLAHIAEAILKLQPNNRSALDTLSRLLVDPNDAEVRQAAAGALSGASVTTNATAIVRLTDALDDANPRVRIMAALSLAQFGPAAVDAVPRLETAASSDVPRMQRAALAALASIRGGQSSLGPAPVATPASNVETPARESAPTPTSGPLQLVPTAPGSHAFSGPQQPAVERTPVERTELEKPATAPFLFPDLSRPTPTDGKFQAVTPTSESAASRVPPDVASHGISIHEEIGSDGSSAVARTHHSGEPSRLPDVPARPIDRAAELPPPRPVVAAPKPAPPVSPPVSPAVSDESPFDLASPPGGTKAGSP